MLLHTVQCHLYRLHSKAELIQKGFEVNKPDPDQQNFSMVRTASLNLICQMVGKMR